MQGEVIVVSLGPGDLSQLTAAARAAVEGAEVIVGYTTYVQLIAGLAPEVPRESSGMHHEVERAARAIDLARAGKRVALVCGGDAGVYSLAGLVLEVLQAQGAEVPVSVLPGVSALNAAAALLGAPLVSDFAAISLSDYLVPLPVILDRVEAAARADFVICLYNPKSRSREAPFKVACEAIGRHRCPDTPVGVVHDAYRLRQRVEITTLAALPNAEVSMTTTIIVGNSTTYTYRNRMVTPRGYGCRYALDGASIAHSSSAEPPDAARQQESEAS